MVSTAFRFALSKQIGSSTLFEGVLARNLQTMTKATLQFVSPKAKEVPVLQLLRSTPHQNLPVYSGCISTPVPSVQVSIKAGFDSEEDIVDSTLAKICDDSGSCTKTHNHNNNNNNNNSDPTLNKEMSSEAQNYLVVFPEYHGDLHTYLRELAAPPPVMTIKILFSQIVHAVQHCHEQCIVIRDLKLGKFMFSTPSRDALVLADVSGSEIVDSFVADRKGSPAYVAPEVFVSRPYDAFKADMWGLGVVLFALCTKSFPFEATTPSELAKRILRGSFVMPENVPKEAEDLIRLLLTKTPHARPSCAQVLAHPFLQSILSESPLSVSVPSLSSWSESSSDEEIEAVGGNIGERYPPNGGSVSMRTIRREPFMIQRSSEDAQVVPSSSSVLCVKRPRQD